MTQLDVSSDSESRPHMGGALELSPRIETKCSNNRSPVPPSACKELMPSARPPAPRSSNNDGRGAVDAGPRPSSKRTTDASATRGAPGPGPATTAAPSLLDRIGFTRATAAANDRAVVGASPCACIATRWTPKRQRRMSLSTCANIDLSL